MLILTDNDVIGAVRVFRRILESPEWVDMTVTLELEFIEFKDIDLPPDAPDVAVWQRSQEVGALLITGNRLSGEGSLDQTIAEQAGPENLPVLTIGDPRRVIRVQCMQVSVCSACWTSLSVSRRYVAPDGFLSPRSGRRYHAFVDYHSFVDTERAYRFQSIRVSRLFQYYEIGQGVAAAESGDGGGIDRSHLDVARSVDVSGAAVAPASDGLRNGAA